MSEQRCPTYEETLTWVTQLHAGQTDKGGHPYIDHPVSVAAGFTEEDLRLAGLLHDVIEDTPTTLEDLRARGYTEEIIDIVDRCSRRPGEPYPEYIERCAGSEGSRRLKARDLLMNADLSRLADPRVHGSLMTRYRAAYTRLTGRDLDADRRTLDGGGSVPDGAVSG